MVRFLIVFCILSIELYAQNGLLAEYYDGANFDRLVATRYDEKIDLSWNNTPPVPGINPHVCSIRWTGSLRPGVTGNYTFAARVDDGIRVWVDDILVIDNWRLNDIGISNGEVEMVGGRDYKLKVEYFNALIEGEIQLLWDIPEANKKRWYNRLLAKKKFVVIESQYFHKPPEYALPQSSEELIADVGNAIPTSPVKKEAPKRQPRQVAAEKTVVKPTPAPVVQEPTETIEEIAIVDELITEEESKEYTPKNVQFERAKTLILEQSFNELHVFADFMKKHENLTVRIEGHTDPIGDAEKNMVLSERRAYAVARFLVKNGIASDRITALGHGGTKPLKIPKEGKYYPENRRVEFILAGFENQESGN